MSRIEELETELRELRLAAMWDATCRRDPAAWEAWEAALDHLRELLAGDAWVYLPPVLAFTHAEREHRFSTSILADQIGAVMGEVNYWRLEARKQKAPAVANGDAGGCAGQDQLTRGADRTRPDLRIDAGTRSG